MQAAMMCQLDHVAPTAKTPGTVQKALTDFPFAISQFSFVIAGPQSLVN
jgi:hypothetical protein